MRAGKQYLNTMRDISVWNGLQSAHSAQTFLLAGEGTPAVTGDDDVLATVQIARLVLAGGKPRLGEARCVALHRAATQLE